MLAATLAVTTRNVTLMNIALTSPKTKTENSKLLPLHKTNREGITCFRCRKAKPWSVYYSPLQLSIEIKARYMGCGALD